jgi:hypothetical protein
VEAFIRMPDKVRGALFILKNVCSGHFKVVLAGADNVICLLAMILVKTVA